MYEEIVLNVWRDKSLLLYPPSLCKEKEGFHFFKCFQQFSSKSTLFMPFITLSLLNWWLPLKWGCALCTLKFADCATVWFYRLFPDFQLISSLFISAFASYALQRWLILKTNIACFLNSWSCGCLNELSKCFNLNVSLYIQVSFLRSRIKYEQLYFHSFFVLYNTLLIYRA